METQQESAKDVETVFEMYDQQKLGFIKLEELENCLQVFNIKMTPEEIEEILDDILPDEKENITLKALTALVRKGGQALMPEEELLLAFQHFDPTDTGLISRPHLEFILTGCGFQLPPSECDKLIKLIMEKEETFNYNKFIKLMRGLGLLEKPKPVEEVKPPSSKPKKQKKAEKLPKRDKTKTPSTPKNKETQPKKAAKSPKKEKTAPSTPKDKENKPKKAKSPKK